MNVSCGVKDQGGIQASVNVRTAGACWISANGYYYNAPLAVDSPDGTTAASHGKLMDWRAGHDWMPVDASALVTHKDGMVGYQIVGANGDAMAADLQKPNAGSA